MNADRPSGSDDWPTEKLRRFVKAWRDGVEITHMAERFGVSVSRVSHLADELGLAPRRGNR